MKFARMMADFWKFVALRAEDVVWIADAKRLYWRTMVDRLAKRRGLHVTAPAVPQQAEREAA